MSVSFEERGAVAYVRLERPGKRNALTREMLDRLAEIFAGVAARGDLRAVILSGAGADFCAGTDIAEIMFSEFRERRFAPPPLLKRMVMAGLYGRKSGRGFYDYADPKNPVPMSLV